jgi:hypothetical protein
MDDDEREAAVRKNAYLFCLAVLAALNILGHPFLIAAIELYGDLPAMRIIAIEVASFLLNMILFGTLPTLYASWASGSLPDE